MSRAFMGGLWGGASDPLHAPVSLARSDVHVEVAEIAGVASCVIVGGLLRMRVFLRLFGAFIVAALVGRRFCRFGLMTAKHAGDGVTEQHAAGHAERGLRRAGEEASTARLLRLHRFAV